MSSLSIKLQEKYQKLVEVSLELQITMLWDRRHDSSTVQKVKFKKERKLYIQSLYMR
jgi:hypothetical protein